MWIINTLRLKIRKKFLASHGIKSCDSLSGWKVGRSLVKKCGWLVVTAWQGERDSS